MSPVGRDLSTRFRNYSVISSIRDPLSRFYSQVSNDAEAFSFQLSIKSPKRCKTDPPCKSLGKSNRQR